MATVRLGSARIDENGKAKGGKAGDQNGREVSTQNWYKHEKGWIVLRPKDRETGRRIAWDMEAACANPHIGYDQGQRLTLYNAASVVDFDYSRVTVDCETDCSALVRVCLAYAGIKVTNFTTANEAGVLMNTGKFEKLTASKYTDKPDYLREGDVLVTASQGHTVVVLNDGPLADDYEPVDPANPVDPDGTYMAITKGNYWLRKEPDKNAKRICVVPAGSAVRVYGRIGDWYGVKVAASGDKGYISKKAMPGWGVGQR